RKYREATLLRADGVVSSAKLFRPKDFAGLWTKRSLNPGDRVTVYVFAAKNGAPVGNVQKIVLPDGQEMNAGAAPPAVHRQADSRPYQDVTSGRGPRPFHSISCRTPN